MVCLIPVAGMHVCDVSDESHALLRSVPAATATMGVVSPFLKTSLWCVGTLLFLTCLVVSGPKPRFGSGTAMAASLTLYVPLLGALHWRDGWEVIVSSVFAAVLDVHQMRYVRRRG